MLKQITKDEHIERIGSEQALRFNLIKSVYIRVIKKDIETERKMINEVMELVPMFETFVKMYEIRTGKDRKNLSILERDALINAFKNRYADKLQGGTNEKVKKA